MSEFKHLLDHINKRIDWLENEKALQTTRYHNLQSEWGAARERLDMLDAELDAMRRAFLRLQETETGKSAEDDE